MSDAKRSTGTIAANAQTVTLSPNGRSVVGLVLTGTWVINLDVKALIDGTEQDAVIVDKSGAAVSLPLTTNQVAYIDAVGREQIIVRANGYTSGTATVTLNATDGKLPSATGGSAVSIADGSDATFGAKADAAAGSDAGTFTFMSLFKRLLQKFTTQFPAALGGTTAANSLAVTLASDGTYATLAGGVTEAAPATDTASSGANGRLQRIAQRLTSLIALLPAALVGGRLDVNVGATVTPANVALDATVTTTNTEIGGLTETAPATDIASSGLNGRLQRVAQRLTSLIALLPAALVGGRLDVNVGATVTPANVALDATVTTTNTEIGGLTEAAPASDTASSGLNGRLQRVAQRLTSLIALLPASIGSKTAAGSLGVALATDEPLIGSLTEAAPGTDTASSGLNGRLQRIAQNITTMIAATLKVQGGVASGAAASGENPVLIAGSDGAGNVLTPRVSASVTDGLGPPSSLFADAFQSDFNGTNWDRHRNNVDVTLLASAARTTLQNSANITVYNCKGIIVTVDVTATVSTVSLTPSINYIDPASGKAIPLLTGTTIAATGTFTYWVDEAALASVPAPFTKTAQAALGRVITINLAVGNANSQTYSIGYTLIP
jgi:hypothetical protein